MKFNQDIQLCHQLPISLVYLTNHHNSDQGHFIQELKIGFQVTPSEIGLVNPRGPLSENIFLITVTKEDNISIETKVVIIYSDIDPLIYRLERGI